MGPPLFSQNILRKRALSYEANLAKGLPTRAISPTEKSARMIEEGESSGNGNATAPRPSAALANAVNTTVVPESDLL